MPEPALRTLREFVVATGRRRVEVLHLGWAEIDVGGPRAPYAWWPADRSLLNLSQFEPGTDLYWLTHKGRIDLRTDVVPTPADIAGSTFLVDRTWVARVRRDCFAGRRLVVRRPGEAAAARVRRRLARLG